MSEHPTPLNDDDLAKVVGGAGALPSMKKDETMPDINSVMKLFQEQAQEMRNAAREARASDMSVQIDSLKGAADDIRSAAEHRFQSAIVAGATQVAGGIASMSLQGSALHGISEKLDKGSALGHAGIDPAGGKGLISHPGIDSVGSKAAQPSYSGVDLSHSAGLSTSAAGLGGIGTIVSAQSETKQAEASASAQAMQAAIPAHSPDLVKEMMNVIKDVKDKLTTMQQSQIETMRNVTKNI